MKSLHSNFHRTDSKSATDTLVRAMEHAERMKFCLVLYETQDDDATPGGLFTQDEVTLSQMNWLLDLAKRWLLDPAKEDE